MQVILEESTKRIPNGIRREYDVQLDRMGRINTVFLVALGIFYQAVPLLPCTYLLLLSEHMRR
jgi:hypothetical protein